MLTSDLVLGSVYRGKLKPAFVFPDGFQHFSTLENLLELFKASKGLSLGDLREEAGELVGNLEGGAAFWKGVVRVLESRLELNAVPPAIDWQARLKIFREAAKIRMAGKWDRPAREELIHSHADALGIPQENFLESLYADLPGNETVLGFDELNPIGLLEEYNLALAQGLALRAESVEVFLGEEGARQLRGLVGGAKFHRLHWEITRHSGSETKIRFDGPMSLFESTTKYGIQLACFLPKVLGLKGGQVSTRLKWGRKSARLVDWQFHPGDAPLPRRIAPGKPSFPELEALETLFNNQIPGWKMSPSQKVISLGEGKFWVPDYQVVCNAENKQLLLEVFPLGTRERMENLVLALEKNQNLPWLLVVQGKTSQGEADKPGIFRFRSFPSPEKLIPYLDQRAVKRPPGGFPWE